MFDEGQQKGTSRILRNRVVNLLYIIFIVMAFLYIPADFIDIFKNTLNPQTNCQLNLSKHYVKILYIVFDS